MFIKSLLFLFFVFLFSGSGNALEPALSEKDKKATLEKLKGKQADNDERTDEEIRKRIKEPLPAHKGKLKLRSYESNTLGYTWDDNDVGFMDFKLSLMYPLFHEGEYDEHTHDYYLPAPYIAFTGRFGQYINSRKSSPVIGKRFNPKIFFRYWLGNEQDYVDIGAAHESNGQRIDSAQAYQNLRKDFVDSGEDPDFANDYISRGWDYWELSIKKGFIDKLHKLEFYLNLKRFLDGGGLQGNPEEYNSWEGDHRFIPRKSVDGLTLAVRYSAGFTLGRFSGRKIFLSGTTGYKDAFEYNSIRAELTGQFLRLPVTIWVSEGYQADLVDYYHRVKSYGLLLELKTYLSDF